MDQSNSSEYLVYAVILVLPNDYRDVYENPHPLLLASDNYRDALPQLDLDAFPEIPDFSIELYDTGNELSPHLRFVSPTLGILTSFPWWDQVDSWLATTPDFWPVGTLEKPFDDVEEGWQVLIWEDKQYVYVMEGEEPRCTEFKVWYKVCKARFATQVEKLMRTI